VGAPQEQGREGAVVKYTVIDCEQKSPEWYAARAGRLTGSCAADMMRKIKSGEAAGRRNLRVKLCLERITGRSLEEDFQSADMANGIEREPVALARYEAECGEIMERVGFLAGDPLMVGCSLDGFVAGRVGIVEAKCPKAATHLEYLRTRTVPSDYYWQCIHNVWVSGARWCDFISYSPDFPEELQYLCVRIEPTMQELVAYEGEVTKFLAEVTVETNEINAMRKAA
jgi:predicted phage-related endonuclease